MLPEVLTGIIKALESKRAYAEVQFADALRADKSYYAGQAAAYTLAIALLKNGPVEDSAS